MKKNKGNLISEDFLVTPCIFLLLWSHREHGYSLYHKLKKIDVNFSPNKLYRYLHKFEKMGLLSSHWDLKEGRPRRSYKLTEKGKEYLKKCIPKVEKVIKTLKLLLSDFKQKGRL